MLGAATVYDGGKGMMEIGADLGNFGTVLRNVSQSVRIMAERSQAEDPVHSAIIQKLGEAMQAVEAAANIADEVPALFRKCHDVDIKRIEAPRIGEHKWDTVHNK
jgi:hypothetical protein